MWILYADAISTGVPFEFLFMRFVFTFVFPKYLFLPLERAELDINYSWETKSSELKLMGLRRTGWTCP